MTIAAKRSPSPSTITAPTSVLLDWRKPRRLADKANALIRALQAIGATRAKAVLDYLARFAAFRGSR